MNPHTVMATPAIIWLICRKVMYMGLRPAGACEAVGV